MWLLWICYSMVTHLPLVMSKALCMLLVIQWRIFLARIYDLLHQKIWDMWVGDTRKHEDKMHSKLFLVVQLFFYFYFFIYIKVNYSIVYGRTFLVEMIMCPHGPFGCPETDYSSIITMYSWGMYVIQMKIL